MKKILLIIIILATGLSLFSLELNKLRVGTEIDLLPYLLGGYYVSGNAALDNYRIRLIYTETYPPDLVIPTGFKDHELKVVAVLADYFLYSKNQKKLWIALGYEHWKNKITSKLNNESDNFDQHILTTGLGWNFYVAESIYINPWAAIHYDIEGKRTHDISGSDLDIKPLLAELSLKIGFRF